MTDSRVALGMDRLPWLPDEPARPAKPPRQSRGGGSGLLGWAFAAILLVAGVSYWLGSRTGTEVTGAPSGSKAPPSATLPLPEATRVVPGEDVQRVAPPEVRPVPEPDVHRVTERAPSWRPLPRAVPKQVAERVKRTIVTDEIDHISQAQGRPPGHPAPAVPRVANTQNVRLWPARESAGATGRVVQIGAFGSRLQAKRGWWHMARAYPAVKRLPAVVVETRNSRGRPFYRFQIGTTSQAHSEVLCQRMEQIRFSCAVVGLPGARKAVER
jgi:sporulation related protein